MSLPWQEEDVPLRVSAASLLTRVNASSQLAHPGFLQHKVNTNLSLHRNRTETLFFTTQSDILHGAFFFPVKAANCSSPSKTFLNIS